ncbi:hypothetical protein SSCG_04773 [Streptomyces clavuligerus]|nr:hypothetical protein SSCG_04773 [Streptomyces clavuligerus]
MKDRLGHGRGEQGHGDPRGVVGRGHAVLQWIASVHRAQS